MNKKLLKLSIFAVIVFSTIFAFRPTEAFASVSVGGGGLAPGTGEPFLHSGCGAGSGNGQVCASTLWVYYTIDDPSKDVYIGSHDGNAGTLTVPASDCGPYGGIWVYQRTHNNLSDRDAWPPNHKYRVATGARTLSSGINRNSVNPATHSTYYPKRGVENSENRNVTPKIPGWPACNTESNENNGAYCYTRSEYWLVEESTVRSYYISANGGSAACTIGGVYYSDCFADYSPITYFCYGHDPTPTTTTYTLTYNANGGKGAPAKKSCSTTGSSCKITVSSTEPTWSGATFLGWATKSTATKADANYAAGTKVKMTKNITLYAVWRSTAKFSGSIAAISSNSDSAIKKVSGSNILGDGKAASFKIKTTYTIKRTNSAPASASSKYTGSNSAQPTSAGTTTGDLQKNATKTKTGTKTAKQAVGTKGSHCFYLTYEKSVQYLSATRQDSTAVLDKINKCATIYNPQYATFSASVKVTSSNMSGNQTDGFTGTGDTDTSYKLTATFTIKRTNDTPTKALSRYNYAKKSTPPTSPATDKDTGDLANGEKFTIPISASFKLTSGQTAEKCFSLSFDKRVGYIGASMLISSFDTREFTGSKSICVTVHNPTKDEATFSGSITAKNGSNLTGTTSTRVGNGLHSQYALTPTYTVKRTNSSPNKAVAPKYAYSDTAMPTKSTGTMKALTKGQTDAKTGKAKTFAAPIDKDTKVCFYLAFDNPIVYLDGKLSERKFNGKKTQCFTVSNPHQSYTSHFTASTTGKIDKDSTTPERFTRDSKDPDHIATINNITRDENGSNVYNYPSNDKYTATFTHTISRTDSDKSSTASTTYYVKNSGNNWEVQYCIDAGCNAGNDGYLKYKASLDNDANVAVSGTLSLAAKAKSTITTRPKWTLNLSNAGKYVYMCQRIAYDKTINYITATNEETPSSYKSKVEKREKAYTTPICVTIKNPRWDQRAAGYVNHYIDVWGSGSTITDAIGAEPAGDNTYKMTKLEATFIWDHTLQRYDNKKNVEGRENSNFDETDSGIKFYQTSIYNNNAFAVTTRVWGSERLPETTRELNDEPRLTVPTGVASGSKELQITLGSTGKSNGEKWTSISTSGRTQTIFTANPADGEYMLLAGQSKKVSQTTVNSPAAWRVQYKTVNLAESYTGWASNVYGSQEYYDHTERISAKPRECILSDGEDRDCGLNDPAVPYVKYESSTPTVYTITRPYNYKVTNVNPESDSSSSSTYTGQEINTTFDITVAKDNDSYDYITDLKNHKGFLIGYIIPKETTISVASTLIFGGRTTLSDVNNINGADACKFFSDRGNNSCTVLENGEKTIKPYKTDTNVGTDKSYNVTFNSSITVPQVETGAKYCVALAIAQYSSSSNDWYISKSACRNVSKRPTVQVLGGDVRSNGSISGSTTKHGDKLYGSWSDFIVSAAGSDHKITGFASAAQLAGGASIFGNDSEYPMCKISALTITNEQCKDNPLATKLGEANIPVTDTAESIIGKMEDYYNTAKTDSNDICDSTRCLITGVNKITENTFTDNGLNNPNSFVSAKPIILYSPTSILIDTNIQLEPRRVYGEIAPSQIIIIAKGDITVADHVTEVDAWIVAGGTFTSCVLNNGTELKLSADVCTEPLTVKGAITAGSINLNRTHGGDPNTDDDESLKTPAEKIYYSPMTLIRAAQDSTLDSEPQPTYTKELPARK